jgi:hypothetical protein
MLDGFTSNFMALGDSFSIAQTRALAEMSQLVTAQAQMMGFIDDFAMLGWIFLLLIPLVFVMRPTPRQSAAPPAAH